MPKFDLQIVTQEKIVYSGECESLIAPGEMGYFGVLAHHAPMLASLGPGKLEIKNGADTQTIQLAGGFLEVQNNHVTILADRIISGQLPVAGEET